MGDNNQMSLIAGAMSTPTTKLATSAVEAWHRRHGFRQTPREPVELLVSLPEWRAHTGPVHDVGVGNGALCRVIQELLPLRPGSATGWFLSDVRREAIEGMNGWKPRQLRKGVRLCHRSALDEWPDADRDVVARCTRAIMNPPWSISRCGTCHAQWTSTSSSKCSKCGGESTDLAIEIVRATMARQPAADVWAWHNIDWPFQAARSRFFDAEVTDVTSHVLAGIDVLYGTRVAYPQPDGTVPKPHNRPGAWYHWVPRDRFVGQHFRCHSWPKGNQ